jgi:hypothetical protein
MQLFSNTMQCYIMFLILFDSVTQETINMIH